MEVYLIRHTTPKIEKGICYGQTDLDVDHSLFEYELKSIQSHLPDDIECFYTSPLKRCSYLAQQLSNQITVDSRLMEMNFGDWENSNWNEIDPDDLNNWMNDFVNIQATNGESYQDLHHRTTEFVDAILATNHAKIALVTHAGNIRSFISFALDLPLEKSFRIQLNYGAIVKLNLDQDPNLCQLKMII